MRILHNCVGYTFSSLQVQFQAGHGHKHPFLVIEQGEHKIHTKTEHLHGELATWQGEHTLQVESRPDHAAGTPFRITVHEHHMVAPDQLIAEGTFVVTPNTFGAQQVNVVLTNKKGYQKGDKSEVWSSPLSSPKGAYLSQGPVPIAASSVYGASQPMPTQQMYMPAQQEYQAYSGQAEQGGSPRKSRDYPQSSPHSLLPQGRGSIVYDTSAFATAYQQQGPSTYAPQSYSQGMQQAQRVSSSSSMSSGQQSPPRGYPTQQYQDPTMMRSISSSSAMHMGQQAPPSPSSGPPPGMRVSGGQLIAPPSLGQQFFEHIEDRPVTKEVVTYVQENHPVAKQYVVETRYTGEEHEVMGASQQAIVGHHERVITAPPVMQQASTVTASHGLFGRHAPHHPPQQAPRGFQQQATVSRGLSPQPMRVSGGQQMVGPAVGQQYFNVVEERPVTKECTTWVQERHPVAKQYVTETRYTGEERELTGGVQQQVVGHRDRYVPGSPNMYGNASYTLT